MRTQTIGGLSDKRSTDKKSDGDQLELALPLPYELREVMCYRVRDNAAISEPNTHPQTLANFIYRVAKEQEDVEHFYVLLLNKRHAVVNYSIVTKGSVDSVLAHPRDVFRAAVYMNASSIVLSHTHPSGFTDPSPEDIAITRTMVEAGKMLGIQVLDHVIVGVNKPLDANGNAGYTSLRETRDATF